MDIFPKLQGEGIEIWKQPEFLTVIPENTQSIYESRQIRWQYPRWTFGIPFEYLLDTANRSDLMAIIKFFLAQKGRGTAFLYQDTQGFSADNKAVNKSVGTGNGSRVEWQLQRTWAGLTEPVNSVDVDSVLVYFDGVEVAAADYSVTTSGTLTFDSPPSNDVVITWTGSYFYIVRFLDDKYKFIQSSSKSHSCDDLQFVGSVQNFV